MSQILAATAKPKLAAVQFQVRKTDLDKVRFADLTLQADDLQDGQILLKIDSFAFTTNNITYAALGEGTAHQDFFPATPGVDLGEKMAYWSFFPSGDNDWGIIPVWGFADVVASRHPAIAVDERLYGYFPMATHLVMTPGKLTDSMLVDATPHRALLPPAYNGYLRITTDPAFAEEFQPYQALLRPLFVTSFLIDDLLTDEDFFGAKTVVLSSASSKTAFGLAHLLHKRQAVTVIGLTSAANRAYAEGLDCYDRVVTYDQIGQLPAEDAAYVDFSGSAETRRAVHEHYGDRLKYSCAVGLTHREANAEHATLPGAKPTFFFAPDRVVKRSRDWGRGGVETRLGAAWIDFFPTLKDSITIIRAKGRAAVEATYRVMLAGKAKPDEGHMLSLCD